MIDPIVSEDICVVGDRVGFFHQGAGCIVSDNSHRMG